MTDFDANLELTKRADAARRCCCSDVDDGLDTARGIIVSLAIGAVGWLIAIGVLLLWVWQA